MRPSLGSLFAAVFVMLLLALVLGCSKRAAPSALEKSQWGVEWAQERSAGACLRSRQREMTNVRAPTTRVCSELEPCYTQSDGLKFTEGDACSNNTPNSECGLYRSSLFSPGICTWKTAILLPEIEEARCLCTGRSDDASQWLRASLVNMRREAWEDCGLSTDTDNSVLVATSAETKAAKILRECLQSLVDSGRGSSIAENSGFRAAE